MTTIEYYKKIYSNTKLSKKSVYREPFFTDLIKITSFLPIDCDYRERIYCLINSIKTRPTCKCGNYVKFPYNSAKQYRHYRIFCSTKCSNNDIDVNYKKSSTCFTNYGVSNPSKSNIIHQKKIDTINSRYGGFAMESPILSEIIKQTNILKYGHQTPSKNQNIKNKIKNSHNNRSKDEILNSNNLRRNTMFLKYGIDHNPIHRYSKVATKYIEHFIKIHKINKDLCLYGNREMFIKINNRLYFYDLVVFSTLDGLKSKNYDDISLVLEYDGAFWHPDINQNITYRNTPMILGGMTYREKYLHDIKKKNDTVKFLKNPNFKFIIFKEHHSVIRLP